MVDDVQALQRADRAGRDLGLQRLEVRVEAAVEGRRSSATRRRGQRGLCGAGLGQVEIERLLAEHRLAGREAGQGEVQVGVGGAGDDDAGHVHIGQGFGEGGHPAAELGRQGLGAVGAGLDQIGKVQARVGLGVAGMDRSHAPGADLSDLEGGARHGSHLVQGRRLPQPGAARAKISPHR